MLSPAGGDPLGVALPTVLGPWLAGAGAAVSNTSSRTPRSRQQRGLPAGAGLTALEPEGVLPGRTPGLTLSFFFNFAPASDASPAVASPSLVAPNVLGRPGSGVAARLAVTDPLPVLSFLRTASLSLESVAFGEPGRLSLPFLAASAALCFPDGVVLPLVFTPEALCSFWSPFLASSSSLRSSDSDSSSES